MQSRAVVDGTEENPNARVRCAVWCEERKGKAGREEEEGLLSLLSPPLKVILEFESRAPACGWLPGGCTKRKTRPDARTLPTVFGVPPLGDSPPSAANKRTLAVPQFLPNHSHRPRTP